MEVADRLAVMEEDYNRVSAEYDEMMSKFDREQQITGSVRAVYFLHYLLTLSCVAIPGQRLQGVLGVIIWLVDEAAVWLVARSFWGQLLSVFQFDKMEIY